MDDPYRSQEEERRDREREESDLRAYRELLRNARDKVYSLVVELLRSSWRT